MERAQKKIKPGTIVLFAATILLAFLFIYPVLLDRKSVV